MFIVLLTLKHIHTLDSLSPSPPPLSLTLCLNSLTFRTTQHNAPDVDVSQELAQIYELTGYKSLSRCLPESSYIID